MKKLFSLAVISVLAVGLGGCGIQKNISAGNADRIAMASALTAAIIAVGQTPNASDDLALGFLIGQGMFKIQRADTAVDYFKGAGYFMREALPWGRLFFDSGASYDGAIFEAGGNILFDSVVADGESTLHQWTQVGSDQVIARDNSTHDDSAHDFSTRDNSMREEIPAY